jgi:salicylate hydroxylase
MAFEDAYVLSRWVRTKADDPEAALANYEAVRKPRATKVQQLSRTEVGFKKQHSRWDRLQREIAFVRHHRLTTQGVFRWIYSYDPVAQWQGT